MFQVLCGAMKAISPFTSVLSTVRNYAVPKHKMIKKKFFVYKPKMKSRYKGNPNPRLTMLLLEDVDDIGMKGDIVPVKRGRGRWDLIPNKLAIYGTAENLIKHGVDPERLKEDNTPKVPLNVLKFLQKHEVKLWTPLQNVNEDGTLRETQSWLITTHDISEYFLRKATLIVPVTCLNILECSDNVIRTIGEYTVQVSLNNLVTVDVPLIVKDRKELDDLGVS